MPISNYSDVLDFAPLYEGQIANLETSIIRTGVNADAADVLVFGRALCKGTGDKDLILPVDATSVLTGIAMATDTFEKRPVWSQNADNDMGYPLRWVVSYLIRGVIGVKLAQAVTPASQVWFLHTPNTGQRKGQFRADIDTNRAIQIPNARYLKSGAAGSVVPLSINLA